MIDLCDRVCVVTGAGQGIGQQVAEGFAKRGAIVVATSLEKPSCDGAAMSLAWDVTDPKRAADVMDQAVSKFGRIDCLVANAGRYPRESWNEIPPEHWRKVLAVNLDGAWFAAREAATHMTARGYGKIVLVGSIEFEFAPAVHVHYVAAKAGLIGLARSMARAVGPSGVRVNCILPGAIQTPAEVVQFPDQAATSKFCDERQCVPGRLKPADIEPSFAFLCSAESDAMTGQVMCVDNGFVHY